jgi:hypothetical protein
MSNETQNQTERHWIVYGPQKKPWGIAEKAWEIRHQGQVTCVGVRYQEGVKYTNAWGKSFFLEYDSSIKAIESVLALNLEEDLIQSFLERFSGQKTTVETILAQSQPKCTAQTQLSKVDSEELEESLEGGLHETFAKDKFPHPNKQY